MKMFRLINQKYVFITNNNDPAEKLSFSLFMNKAACHLRSAEKNWLNIELPDRSGAIPKRTDINNRKNLLYNQI